MTKCLRVTDMPGNQDGKQSISYWIYEFKFKDEDMAKLEEAVDRTGMTFDKFFISAMKYACEKAEHDPEGFEIDRRHVLEHPEEHLQIELDRLYPVLEGETESEALERFLAGR